MELSISIIVRPSAEDDVVSARVLAKLKDVGFDENTDADARRWMQFKGTVSEADLDNIVSFLTGF